MVFLKVDYEHNTATGLPKKCVCVLCERKRKRKRESRRDTFLMGARLVMKHIVHKPHTVEYGIIPKRFLQVVMRA